MTLCVSDENDVSTAPDNNVLTNTSDDDDTTTNTETEDPRNKRFLFNLRGGGGGGSGNFLFDMIRVSVYIPNIIVFIRIVFIFLDQYTPKNII